MLSLAASPTPVSAEHCVFCGLFFRVVTGRVEARPWKHRPSGDCCTWCSSRAPKSLLGTLSPPTTAPSEIPKNRFDIQEHTSRLAADLSGVRDRGSRFAKRSTQASLMTGNWDDRNAWLTKQYGEPSPKWYNLGLRLRGPVARAGAREAGGTGAHILRPCGLLRNELRLQISLFEVTHSGVAPMRASRSATSGDGSHSSSSHTLNSFLEFPLTGVFLVLCTRRGSQGEPDVHDLSLPLLHPHPTD